MIKHNLDSIAKLTKSLRCAPIEEFEDILIDMVTEINIIRNHVKHEEKPKRLSTMDFTGLACVCEEYIDNVDECGKYQDDKDSKESIVMAALESIYDGDISNWLDKQE